LLRRRWRPRKNKWDEDPPTIKQASQHKETVKEYYYYIGSSKKASDYKTTSEYIINYIKKTFNRGNNVAKALQTLVRTDPETWKPTLKASKETNQADKDQENEQFKMEYKAELDEALKRKRMYNNNVFKVYSLMWERYAEAKQNKLLAWSDYEDKLYNNLIKLLKAIKEHALNYQETHYKMSIIWDALQAM